LGAGYFYSDLQALDRGLIEFKDSVSGFETSYGSFGDCVSTFSRLSRYPHRLMRVSFMRHITGDSRQQATLLPGTLEDCVDGDHPVRVIDAFVDMLDMRELGFSMAETQFTGRKPCHPGDLLKLYIYGYLNQTRSSRRLEKASRLSWL